MDTPLVLRRSPANEVGRPRRGVHNSTFLLGRTGRVICTRTPLQPANPHHDVFVTLGTPRRPFFCPAPPLFPQTTNKTKKKRWRRRRGSGRSLRRGIKLASVDESESGQQCHHPRHALHAQAERCAADCTRVQGPGWRGINVVISDSNVKGGEHRCGLHPRQGAWTDGTRTLGTCCRLDADLIMLALATLSCTSSGR